MKKILTSITLFFLFLVSPTLSASVADLQAGIDGITSSLSDNAGIKIYSLSKKQVLYGRNEKKLLNPASTTKLITAAASLRLLGPDYKFHTQFFITPHNDLYIAAKGDPSLVIEELRGIADSLIKNGAGAIRHMIVNEGYFGGYTQPGLPPEKKGYNSFTGALSLNFNRIKIKVKPGAKVGDPAAIEADAGDIVIPVENEVKTGPKRSGSVIDLLPPPTKKGEEIFTVTGRIPISSKGFIVERHVNIPPLYFSQALMEILKQKGCKITGEVFTGPKPNGSKLILDHESKPLSEILEDMNKFSNNFIAEQLVKVLGAEFLKQPGTTAKGIAVIKKYLASLGITPHEYNLVNGSGLTYENRMSADQLIRIFQDMYSDKKIWTAFDASLSVWGRDGTLRRRKNSAILKDSAHAKTGSLDFVKTIAGVVPSADGEVIAYAILLNGGNNMSGFRKVQEEIIEEVAKLRR